MVLEYKKYVPVLCFLSLLLLSSFNLHVLGSEKSLLSDNNKIISRENVFSVGNAFANNAINTTIYRHHGIVTAGNYQYLAFFVDAHRLRIIKRDIKSSAAKPEIFEIPGVYDVSDTHNTISIGIDRLGYIHLSYAQHGSKLNYRRSKRPLSITEWTDEIAMTGLREKQVTYPAFIMPRTNSPKLTANDILFIYRDGRSGNGDICIKKYNSDSLQWQDIEPCIIVGSEQSPWSSNPYLNHVAIDSSDTIHFSYVWRTHFLGEKKILNNIGIDYAASGDWGETWQTSLGREYRLPITQVNSETIYAVSPGNNLINQTSSAIDSKDHPHIVYYANDDNGIPQYQHVWFNGKKWQHSYLSLRTQSFLLHGSGSLDIPISRPEILIDKKDRVYLIYRGDLSQQKMAVTRFLPPNYDLETSSSKMLWAKDIGYAEPVIDRLRWEQDHILSMYIQKSGRASNRDVTKILHEPAYIVDWDIVNAW